MHKGQQVQQLPIKNMISQKIRKKSVQSD